MAGLCCAETVAKDEILYRPHEDDEVQIRRIALFHRPSPRREDDGEDDLVYAHLPRESNGKEHKLGYLQVANARYA